MTERGFYSSLARGVIRRRWWILAGYLGMTAALGWSASRIGLKADVADLLPQGAASADDLRFYLERFGSSDAFFFRLTLSGSDDVGRLEDAASRLSAELESTGLFRSLRYGFTEEDALLMARRAMAHLPVLLPDGAHGLAASLLRPESVRARLARLKRDAEGPLMFGPRAALAAEDPLGLLALLPAAPKNAGPGLGPDPGSGLLLSPDGASLLLVARPIRPAQDVAFARRLVESALAAERRVTSLAPGLSVDHAGGHLFAVQDEARLRHDISTTATIALLAIAGLFALVLRSVWLPVILITPLALSTLWTLGVAAIYPGHLNVVSVAFAAILLGMGDDSLTHLYLRAREGSAGGLGWHAALELAMVSTGPSILIATLTSGVAFASLNFVRFRGLSELGLISAIGLVNLLVTTLLLFPAMLSLREPAAPGRPSFPGIPAAPLVAFHRWGARHRGLVLALTSVLVLAAGAACSKLTFSSDIRALRGEDPARERLETVLAPFGGAADPIHLVLQADSLDQALAAQQHLADQLGSLQSEGLIAGHSAAAAWLPPEAAQRARFESLSTLPWAAAAAHLRAACDELGLNASFFSPFLANLDRYGSWEGVRIDPTRSDLPAEVGDQISADAVAMAVFPQPGQAPDRALARLRELTPASGARLRIASTSLVLADLEAIIAGDFRRAALIALAAVGIIALVALRSVPGLLLAAAPVAIGCLAMLGGLALLGIPINLMNMVALPLVFGLGIDFGVYMVNRHEEEGRADVARVLRHTGGAVLMTGLTTLAGFGSLLSARFEGLRSMGWVAVLGIGGCLVAALLVLPLLLPAAAGPEARASHRTSS